MARGAAEAGLERSRRCAGRPATSMVPSARRRPGVAAGRSSGSAGAGAAGGVPWQVRRRPEGPHRGQLGAVCEPPRRAWRRGSRPRRSRSPRPTSARRRRRCRRTSPPRCRRPGDRRRGHQRGWRDAPAHSIGWAIAPLACAVSPPPGQDRRSFPGRLRRRARRALRPAVAHRAVHLPARHACGQVHVVALRASDARNPPARFCPWHASQLRRPAFAENAWNCGLADRTTHIRARRWRRHLPCGCPGGGTPRNRRGWRSR